MSCKLQYPQRYVCSGNGVCEQNTCVCYQGWTGYGDYATPGQDCDININAIKGLAIVNIAFACASIMVIFSYLHLRKTHKMMNIFDLKIAFPLVFLVGEILDIAYCSLKLQDPIRNVAGNKTAIGYLFLLLNSYVASILGLSLYMQLLTNLIISFTRVISLQSQAKMKSTVLAFKIYIKYMALVFVAVLCIPYVGIAVVKQQSQFHIVGTIVFTALGVAFILFACIFIPTINFIIRELDNNLNVIVSHHVYIKDDPVRRTCKTLKFVRLVFGTVLLSSFPVCIALAYWPTLLNKTSYILLMMSIMYRTIKYVALYSVSNFKSSQRKVFVYEVKSMVNSNAITCPTRSYDKVHKNPANITA